MRISIALFTTLLTYFGNLSISSGQPEEPSAECLKAHKECENDTDCIHRLAVLQSACVTNTCQPQCRMAALNLYQNRLGRNLMRTDTTCLPGKYELEKCGFLPNKSPKHCNFVKLMCEADLQCNAKWEVFVSECESETSNGQCSDKCRRHLNSTFATSVGADFRTCTCTDKEDHLCDNLKNTILKACTETSNETPKKPVTSQPPVPGRPIKPVSSVPSTDGGSPDSAVSQCASVLLVILSFLTMFYPEFITEDTCQELVDLVKELQVFKTLNKDTVPVNRTYKNIGEAIPISPDGTCSKPFYIPTLDGNECILPGRYEMNRHWMKYGGLEGLKETYDELTSRIKFFMYAKYVFDIKNHPVVKSLFYSEKFVKAAKEICPEHKQFLDPYQFIFLLQVPGQTVPIHLDPPYFTRTSRYHIPEWLLIVMIGSGLFQDDMHHHVQGVAYLHEWNTTQNAGLFANSIVPSYISPNPRTVMLMDGSKTMHAAALYRPEIKAPLLPETAENELTYHPDDDLWDLTSDKKLLGRYRTSDLRISIVYRALCFENEEKKNEYHDWLHSGKDLMPLDKILGALKGGGIIL